jgi:hypothetical protein
MNRAALEHRARALHAQRHLLRDKRLACHRRFPEGTAVIVEQGGFSVLYRGQSMLSVDLKGSVQSPLSDSGLGDLLQTLECVLQPA